MSTATLGKWTDSELASFRKLASEGHSLREIAKVIGRSARALEKKRYEASLALSELDRNFLDSLAHWTTKDFSMKEVSKFHGITGSDSRRIMTRLQKALFFGSDIDVVVYARRSAAVV